MFDHFCGLDIVHVSSMFRHDYREVLFFVFIHPGHRVALSDVDACGIVYVQQGNTTA